MNKRLENLVKENSGICVGLDPDLTKFPSQYHDMQPEEAVLFFLPKIVDLTAPYACAYKIQKAFFDIHEKGLSLLRAIVEYVHFKVPAAPVFIDSKVGDISNTMEVYANLLLKDIGADGITVNPYMGSDVFEPLQKYPDKGIIILTRTSNPSAAPVQDVPVVVRGVGIPLWLYIFDTAIKEWNTNSNIIPVVSSHAELKNLRSRVPDTMPFLYAGVGAQGGDIHGIRYLLNSNNSGVFVNSSRAILYPYNRKDPNWEKKVVEAAASLATKIKEIKDGS